MPEQTLQTANETTRQRPFPWHCPRCRKKEVYPAVVPYRCDMAHDGRTYSIAVPELTVPRCGNCAELVFNYPAEEQIRNALRSQLRLLAPDDLRRLRAALGFTPKDLADRLGVPGSTVLRWETGDEIQSRAMDNLLRVFFAFPEVRSVLLGSDQDPHLGIGTISAPANP